MAIPGLNQVFCLEYRLLMTYLMIWQIEKTSLKLQGFLKIMKQSMYTLCTVLCTVQYSIEISIVVGNPVVSIFLPLKFRK